jgi:hypothetical protein
MSGDLDAQLKLFSAMDTDGSGGLDRDEFVTAALHIDDDMFTQWVDHVLYQDVLATEEERMAQVVHVIVECLQCIGCHACLRSTDRSSCGRESQDHCKVWHERLCDGRQ